MTTALYREDAYLSDAKGRVVGLTSEGGIILDQTIFYPTGGGQPGDSGKLTWDGGMLEIASTLKGEGEEIVLIPAAPGPALAPGTVVTQSLDWTRRHRHMRMHTALHLLTVVLPLPVTGGSIGSEKGRLDFVMPQPPEDKEELEQTLNKLIACDFTVNEEWITDEELQANPDLVKTMTVKPPMGAGRVRLIRIGSGENTADLQPCGGTHVASTAEIGPVRLGKIESKGKQNRRVTLHFA